MEGQQWTGEVASFSDPDSNDDKGTADTYGATIYWGDGTASAGTITSTGRTSGTVSGIHTYAEESGSQPYNVTVVVGDTDNGAQVSIPTTATVADAPLTALGESGPAPLPSPTVWQVNESYTQTIATFKDADPGAGLGDFTLSDINWGDGTSSPPR